MRPLADTGFPEIIGPNTTSSKVSGNIVKHHNGLQIDIGINQHASKQATADNQGPLQVVGGLHLSTKDARFSNKQAKGGLSVDRKRPDPSTSKGIQKNNDLTNWMMLDMEQSTG